MRDFKNILIVLNVIKILFISQEKNIKKPAILSDLDDYEPLQLSSREKDIFNELHYLSEKDNYEYIAYVYSDGETIYKTSKKHNVVSINKALIRKQTKIFHSHTTDSPISYVDIMKLLEYNIEEIGVICKNKDVYKISIGQGYIPDKSTIDDFIESIDSDITNTVLQNKYFNDLTIQERNYLYYKERLFRIVREYGWTYKGGSLNE